MFSLRPVIVFILFLLPFMSCKRKPAPAPADATAVPAIATAIPAEAGSSISQKPEEKTLCFLFTEGLKNEDSTFVKLIFKGNEVSGDMHWQPHQKDGAVGTLAGVIEENIIYGIYHYVIEGSDQLEDIEMKLENGELYKKSGELIEKTEADGTPHLVFKDAQKGQWRGPYKKAGCL